MRDDEERELRATRAEMLQAFNEMRAVRGKPPLKEFPAASCSFCGEPKEDVGPLVQGLSENVFICRGCATEAQHVLLRGNDGGEGGGNDV
jgi:hypothetical protein